MIHEGIFSTPDHNGTVRRSPATIGCLSVNSRLFPFLTNAFKAWKRGNGLIRFACRPFLPISLLGLTAELGSDRLESTFGQKGIVDINNVSGNLCINLEYTLTEWFGEPLLFGRCFFFPFSSLYQVEKWALK